MRKLELENFKAFDTNVCMAFPNGENVLIYGENGSGKSSFFESIKLFYFKERLLREQIPPNIVGEERVAYEQRILEEYKSKVENSIKIKIDEEDFNNHDTSDDSIFLISFNNLNVGDDICIKDIVNQAYFSNIDNTIPWISKELADLIVEDANKVIHDSFWLYDVTLQNLDSEGKCALQNKDNPIPKQSKLSKFFNEAILHVVRFVVLIESIVYFVNEDKHPIIVMDDCFNSLDMPNRTFMMRYLLNVTKGIQKIVLTHNTGFFNLFSYIAKNAESGTWIELQLCLVDGKHRFLDGTEKTTKELIGNSSNTTLEALGNGLRQRFEILIYQLTRLNNIGELQETSDLLDKLCSPNSHIHLSIDGNGKLKDIYTLINEIYANLTNGNTTNLQKRLKEKIDEYRKNDFLKSLKPILTELRLMQKVALHQTSHGHSGLPPVSANEIKVSSALLCKLESAIQNVTRRIDVSSI